jgi:hypothetical protein
MVTTSGTIRGCLIRIKVLAARLPGPDRRTELCPPHETAVADAVLPDGHLAQAAPLKPLLGYPADHPGLGALRPR